MIQRIGHWLLDPFGTAYIVPGFQPEALLALAFWPGAAQKDFTGFWAERFHVYFPEELRLLVMPALATLRQQVAEFKDQARSGDRAAAALAAEAENALRVLHFGAMVVLQDALELATQSPHNPVHKLLLENDKFRCALQVLVP